MVMTVTPGSCVYCFIESDGRPWISVGDRWTGGVVQGGEKAADFPRQRPAGYLLPEHLSRRPRPPPTGAEGVEVKARTGGRSELSKRKKFLDATRTQNAVNNNFLKYSWTPCFIHFESPGRQGMFHRIFVKFKSTSRGRWLQLPCEIFTIHFSLVQKYCIDHKGINHMLIDQHIHRL